MIQISIMVQCDECGYVGGGIAAHRWIPHEPNLPKPDFPKGWQLINTDKIGWQTYCQKCFRLPGEKCSNTPRKDKKEEVNA